MDQMTDHPTRLIVYGSLAPGGANAFLLAGSGGEWHHCRIRGQLGTYQDFKSFRYDPQGPEHPAWLLESPDLPWINPPTWMHFYGEVFFYEATLYGGGQLFGVRTAA